MQKFTILNALRYIITIAGNDSYPYSENHTSSDVTDIILFIFAFQILGFSFFIYVCSILMQNETYFQCRIIYCSK